MTLPFGEDGGYTGQQWVGANTINGATVTGWAGHPNSPDSPAPVTMPPVATSTPATGATFAPASSGLSPSTTVGTVIAGSGPDTIALTMAEDAYQGDAEFIVLVDGTQIGGTQTVTAQQGLGQSQRFDIEGAFSSDANAVDVVFLNDLSGGSPNADRNLHVLGATYDGSSNPADAVAAPSAQDALLADGGFSFTVDTAVPGATTIGSGPDQLQLTVAEQALAGDAQFTVSVDGVQVGGTQTVTAIAADQGNAEFTVNVDGTQIGGVQTASAISGNGQSQVFDVYGSFSGSHTVSVDFLNDATSTPFVSDLDRNLYVGSASVDGTSIANSSLALLPAGAQSFSFTH